VVTGRSASRAAVSHSCTSEPAPGP
jgi:hypothetical protein